MGDDRYTFELTVEEHTGQRASLYSRGEFRSAREAVTAAKAVARRHMRQEHGPNPVAYTFEVQGMEA